MDLNKVPRWALISIASVGLLACGALVQNAQADLVKVKTVAYQAKGTADDAYALSNDLKVQIADVRVAQETFRREYREDQKDLNGKLTELLKAVKA